MNWSNVLKWALVATVVTLVVIMIYYYRHQISSTFDNLVENLQRGAPVEEQVKPAGSGTQQDPELTVTIAVPTPSPTPSSQPNPTPNPTNKPTPVPTDAGPVRAIGSPLDQQVVVTPVQVTGSGPTPTIAPTPSPTPIAVEDPEVVVEIEVTDNTESSVDQLLSELPPAVVLDLPPVDQGQASSSNSADEAETQQAKEPAVECVETRKPAQFVSNFERRSLWRVRIPRDEIGLGDIWSNWTDPNPSWKVILPSGFDKKIKGGGTVRFYPASCSKSKEVSKALKELSGTKVNNLPGWVTN